MDKASIMMPLIIQITMHAENVTSIICAGTKDGATLAANRLPAHQTVVKP